MCEKTRVCMCSYFGRRGLGSKIMKTVGIQVISCFSASFLEIDVGGYVCRATFAATFPETVCQCYNPVMDLDDSNEDRGLLFPAAG